MAGFRGLIPQMREYILLEAFLPMWLERLGQWVEIIGEDIG